MEAIQTREIDFREVRLAADLVEDHVACTGTPGAEPCYKWD
jgi:hypothetical protein